jgi:hypothetical protein
LEKEDNQQIAKYKHFIEDIRSKILFSLRPNKAVRVRLEFTISNEFEKYLIDRFEFDGAYKCGMVMATEFGLVLDNFFNEANQNNARQIRCKIVKSKTLLHFKTHDLVDPQKITMKPKLVVLFIKELAVCPGLSDLTSVDEITSVFDFVL